MYLPVFNSLHFHFKTVIWDIHSALGIFLFDGGWGDFTLRNRQGDWICTAYTGKGHPFRGPVGHNKEHNNNGEDLNNSPSK